MPMVQPLCFIAAPHHLHCVWFTASADFAENYSALLQADVVEELSQRLLRVAGLSLDPSFGPSISPR